MENVDQLKNRLFEIVRIYILTFIIPLIMCSLGTLYKSVLPDIEIKASLSNSNLFVFFFSITHLSRSTLVFASLPGTN